ncbi:TetR family transcriptional regulator [Pediococcus damnosus]|nr:TetR family transcriptional regulator [Pediococcus damnosus]PIO86204.1 TetR family transcriptional regulator [Pediococcus damnosus]PJE50250.1 TetR/AcrR family transcriptional regulator [Pediococcus damnosus]
MTDKQIKILAAAVDVFAEKGYANTSTKEIAKKAGVAEGNIFNKFTNKRGLLHAIVTPVMHSFFPASLDTFVKTQLTKTYPSLEAFITALVQDRFAFLKKNSKVIKILVSEMLYDQKVRAQLTTEFTGTYWHEINKQLDFLKSKHLIVDWSNIEILKTMWSITGGTILGYLYFDQPLSKTSTKHAITALVKALRY